MRRQIFALGFALLLAGCSSASPEQSGSGPDDALGQDDALTDVDVSDASDAQAAEISDRKVTADEYQAAFRRYRECLSAAGFELRDVDLSGPVYEYGVPSAAVDDGTDSDCYQSEFRYVDMLWQSSDEVQNNSETAEIYRECLRERGIEPAGTMEGMESQLREANFELPECFS